MIGSEGDILCVCVCCSSLEMSEIGQGEQVELRAMFEEQHVQICVKVLSFVLEQVVIGYGARIMICQVGEAGR